MNRNAAPMTGAHLRVVQILEIFLRVFISLVLSGCDQNPPKVLRLTVLLTTRKTLSITHCLSLGAKFIESAYVFLIARRVPLQVARPVSSVDGLRIALTGGPTLAPDHLL